MFRSQLNSSSSVMQNKNSFMISARKTFKKFFFLIYCYFVAKNDIAIAKCSGTLFRKVMKLVE